MPQGRTREEMIQWTQIAPDGAQGSLPMLGTGVMSADVLRSGTVRMVPMGGNTYRMEVIRSGEVLDVATETGALFLIDAQKLLQTVLP
jgi:hypothetical protein